MLSRFLPYLLALAASLLAWSESQRADAIATLLSSSQSSVRQLTQDNRGLKGAVEYQNAEVLAIKQRASRETLDAAGRAAEKMATLPAKLKSDRNRGAQPEEMNQWLDSLFSY